LRLIKFLFAVVCILCFLTQTGFAQKYESTWESLDSRPIPTWFQDAKFGIFIHWGVYSVPAWRPISSKLYASYAEWYYARVIDDKKNGGDIFHRKNYGEDFDYRDFAPMFKAELFDPDYWAELFHRAGARYVVLTSKHHDGFCLWPTKSPFKKNWNSLESGPKRDLLGDLTKAVRKKGLRMGLYYSLIEWETTPTKRTESGYFVNEKTVQKYQIPTDRYVDEHILLQLRELVLNYRPALIFSDGGEWDFDEDYWKTKEFLAWLYNEGPNRDEVVVNDRWAKGMPGKHGDYFSSEYKDTDAVGLEHPWEESRGVGGSYGFNRAENLDDYSTSAELIYELIGIVSNGGNLLLNVGPTADGRIPVIMQQRLIDIGDWLKINGEAIYGTRPWRKIKADVKGESQGIFYTTKGGDLYVICTKWPGQDVQVPDVRTTANSSVRLLGLEKSIQCKSGDGGIVITPPIISPAEVPCQHAYVFKISNALKN
jgi:alpha-L-fucosidase